MLEIIRIHNELLGTYGDRGNADVLKYRAGLRKIRSRITDISYLDPLPKREIFIFLEAQKTLLSCSP